jgi:hypothetical protein
LICGESDDETRQKITSSASEWFVEVVMVAGKSAEAPRNYARQSGKFGILDSTSSPLPSSPLNLKPRASQHIWVCRTEHREQQRAGTPNNYPKASKQHSLSLSLL